MPAHASSPVPLNAHILLYQAEANSLATHSQQLDGPSIILLFGWMDAHLDHLQKYVDHHRSIYPGASIVLIRSSTSYYMNMQSTREKILHPVVNFINGTRSAHAARNELFRGILVHVMSNGGGFQLVTLQKAFVAKNKGGMSPPAALVFDSTPGDNGLLSAVSFMAPSHPVLRVLVIPAITLVYSLFHVTNALGGNLPVFHELRDILNSPNVLPGIVGEKIPRLYIFSSADRITSFEEVERHIEAAKASGFKVFTEKFNTTGHVAHARADPNRYWGAIRNLWSTATEDFDTVTAQAYTPKL